jgi:integrase
MSIFKRGRIYWYKFMWDGKLVRESTKQGNDKVARQMEAAHRTSLAKGEVGIRERKPLPTLKDFIEHRVEPYAKPRKAWNWYRAGIKPLKTYAVLAGLRLDEINGEKAAGFAVHEQSRKQTHGRENEKSGLAVGSVNRSLRVLRRILRLAVEWGVLEKMPRIELLPGEVRRERVITPEEEARYLLCAPLLLADVATVLFDTGMRPDECHRLRWENITWVIGRHGTILITHGKTAAARRLLPMTPRVRHVLDSRWEKQGKPAEGWVSPAETKERHINHSTVKKQHARAFRIANDEAEKGGLPKLRPFLLYSARHTFLTRLGASGCDAWALAKIAGHSSIAMSSRYVHPNEESVLAAVSRIMLPSEAR